MPGAVVLCVVVTVAGTGLAIYAPNVRWLGLVLILTGLGILGIWLWARRPWRKPLDPSPGTGDVDQRDLTLWRAHVIDALSNLVNTREREVHHLEASAMTRTTLPVVNPRDLAWLTGLILAALTNTSEIKRWDKRCEAEIRSLFGDRLRDQVREPSSDLASSVSSPEFKVPGDLAVWEKTQRQLTWLRDQRDRVVRESRS